MKDWIEIVRDKRFFNVLSSRSARDSEKHKGSITINYPTSRGVMAITHHAPRALSDVKDFPGKPPSYFAHSDATVDKTVFKGEGTYSIDSAGNLTFLWVDQRELGSLLSVTAPRSSGSAITCFRDDGFPALIMMSNIRKYYREEVLHRWFDLPAIHADYIAAMWYEDSSSILPVRNAGPPVIVLENYKEFWEYGEFKKRLWKKATLQWDPESIFPYREEGIDLFLQSLQGETNILSNTFFTDPQDEVCFLMDFK